MTINLKDFLSVMGLGRDDYAKRDLVNHFLEEMKKGLWGAPGSLAMLPAFIDPGRVPLMLEKPVIVIDAGGTHLRIGLASPGQGGPDIVLQGNYPMPGIKQAISQQQFYKTLTQYLEPVLHESNRIGFCFSYPIAMQPDHDGRLLHWSKGIHISGMEGKLVARGLQRHLYLAGFGKKKIVLLNDAVSALLACLAVAKNASGYLGVILGTGFNIAYVEENQNIAVIQKKRGKQIINIEPGSFTGHPQGPVDVELDRDTYKQGNASFEKMVAGAYLGNICQRLFLKAAEQQLLSRGAITWLKKTQPFDTVQASYLLNRNETEKRLNKNDLIHMKTIAQAVVERAAFLASCAICAAI